MSFKVSIAGPSGKVIFQASAPLSESRAAAYDGYNIVHLPTAMYAYRSTGGRKFQVQGRMVSRNAKEGGANARYLNLIRTWVLPDFGGTGATPPIVRLNAYNNDNIQNLQCVVLSYSWNFPDDVDYVDSIPEMPVIGMLSVDLEEVYSAEQITAKAWKIRQTAFGSFEGGADSVGVGGSGGGGGGGGMALGSSFGGSRGASSAGSLLGVLGTIGGALGGKKVFGNNAGAALGSIIGGALGDAVSNSPILRDIGTSIGALNNNVFVSGVPAASIAEQTNTSAEAFRQQERAFAQDAYQRDQNPAPPDQTDFYG